jgi:hypothetical protein
VVVEREAGKIAYVLEDDALGGLLHFSTPVVRRFYEHPDGRDSSAYAPSSSSLFVYSSIYLLIYLFITYLLYITYINNI